MSTDDADFIPPFCPNPRCQHHVTPRDWRWHAHGTYQRRASPRCIRRFRCAHCGRTFSTQTFSVTYWLRHPELPIAVFHRTLACSAFRQMSHESGVSHTTMMRLAARLGRHCLLYSEAHRPVGPIREPLVIDGFESFEFSQYHPIHLNLAVGARSHFLYAFTGTELRRKGRMTDAQRSRREQLEARFGRPDPKALELDVAELMRLAARQAQTLVVRSDEHPAYPRAFRRVPTLAIEHECTNSREPRTAANPLFPVNLADLLIRHGSANHKRETIAFSKRRQGAIERLAMLVVWRNHVKRFSETTGGPTPAMVLGLASRPRSLGEVLERRLFTSRIGSPEVLMRYYRRLVPTRRIPNGSTHALKYAF